MQITHAVRKRHTGIENKGQIIQTLPDIRHLHNSPAEDLVDHRLSAYIVYRGVRLTRCVAFHNKTERFHVPVSQTIIEDDPDLIVTQHIMVGIDIDEEIEVLAMIK